MNYPIQKATRLTRAGELVTLSRYPVTGYYEITKEINGYFTRKLFDTSAEAWRYYRHNRKEN